MQVIPAKKLGQKRQRGESKQRVVGAKDTADGMRRAFLFDNLSVPVRDREQKPCEHPLGKTFRQLGHEWLGVFCRCPGASTDPATMFRRDHAQLDEVWFGKLWHVPWMDAKQLENLGVSHETQSAEPFPSIHVTRLRPSTPCLDNVATLFFFSGIGSLTRVRSQAARV